MTNIEIIEGAWGQSELVDIQAVLDSVIKVFWDDASIIISDGIIIHYTAQGYPQVLVERGSNNEHIVLLDSRDRLWAQLSYQFAHEYCHVFTKFYQVPLRHRFRWFEEALCELASVYALTRMGDNWQDCPPYPNWRSYSTSLTAYANDRIATIARYESPEIFRDWLESNFELLSNDSEIRELNNVVALQMLSTFLALPMLWDCCTYLNYLPNLNGSFADYLESWVIGVPDRMKASVTQLLQVLGY